MTQPIRLVGPWLLMGLLGCHDVETPAPAPGGGGGNVAPGGGGPVAGATPAAGSGGASGAGGAVDAGGRAGESDGAGADSGPAATGNAAGTVTGTVRGQPAVFAVGAAYWIGTPDPGTPPTSDEAPVTLFLLEAPLTCADISRLLWDRAARTQILAIGLSEVTAKVHPIGKDAIASYQARAPSAFNPDATGGTVTITSGATRAVGQNAIGAYDITFAGAAATALRGTFNAAHCPTGVEP